MKKIAVSLMLALLMALTMVSCVEQQPVVENTPPTAPTNPDPADGAKDVSIDKLYLEWDASTDPDGDIISYDVYFGESQDSMKIIDKDLGKTYTYMPDLKKSKTYYWKVVAKDYNDGETSSKVWSFSTEEGVTPLTPANPTPSDKATGVEINVRFSWSDCKPDNVYTTIKYKLYLGTSADKLELKKDDINYNYVSLDDNLEFETTYYWQIETVSSDGISVKGPVWSFTTMKYTSLTKPSNPSPADDAVDVELTPTLSWTESVSSLGETVEYDLYFGTDENNLEKYNTYSFEDNSYKISSELELNTTYYWKVAAKTDSDDPVESDVWSFTTIKTLSPSAPQLTAPNDDATGQPITGIEFTWKASTDPNGETVTYNFYLGTAENTLKQVNENPITDTTYTLTEKLDYETTYYWQVEAVNASGGKAKSVIRSFTTAANEPPAKVTNPVPSDGASGINPENITLSWSKSTDPNNETVSYEVYFGDSETNLVKKTTTTETSYDLSETLENSTTYYWRVDAVDESGNTTKGDVWSFTTAKEAIQNGYMFVYGNNILAIYDVNTDPERPVFISSIALSHYAKNFSFDGVYLYTEYLDIIDLSDVENPKLMEKKYDAYTPLNARDIVVSNGYAYIIDYYNGLIIVDISDKLNPKKVGEYDPGFAYGVYVDGNYAYVAATDNGLVIVDISDKTNPIEVGRYDTAGSVNNVYIDGNYAYIADSYKGLVIVDISNKTNPIKVAAVSTNGFAYEIIGIKTYGTQKYVFLGTYGGLQAVDITDLNNAYLVDSHFDDFSVFHGVISGDYAYVTGNGYAVVDISDQYNFDKSIYEYVEKNVSYPMNSVHVDDYDIIAAGESGLVIYNETAKKTYTLYLGGYVREIYVDGNYAYVAAGDEGFIIVDISDKTNPTKIGGYDPGDVSGVYVDGNYAYITGKTWYSKDIVIVMDISDKTTPKEISTYSFLGLNNSAFDIYIKENYAYITYNNYGFIIMDISDKANPIKIGTYNTNHAGNITVNGDYAYLADGSNGLVIVNIRDKTNPTKVGAYDTGYACNVIVNGDYAYVGDCNNGLVIVRVSDVTNPIKIRNYDYGDVYGVELDATNNVVYLGGSMGYMQVDVSTPSLAKINWQMPMSDFGAILLW
ncbi:hypothetical protein [Marinitoga sp. 1138]|uniref:fibronectin type III domain-containing protein n=1 Tax=Marinitoga sp. 1138 TaxID=1643334 RepID=UPI0015868467|nr:hypothetical protein [Marinitoga sp. 1138]NUU98458.1 hypothetical protein [Marinitoga sp. 1138]